MCVCKCVCIGVCIGVHCCCCCHCVCVFMCVYDTCTYVVCVYDACTCVLYDTIPTITHTPSQTTLIHPTIHPPKHPPKTPLPKSPNSNVGFWATLALNIPDFSRYARSQRDQIVGQAVGLPLFMAAFSFIGLAVTSATVVMYGSAISMWGWVGWGDGCGVMGVV